MKKVIVIVAVILIIVVLAICLVKCNNNGEGGVVGPNGGGSTVERGASVAYDKPEFDEVAGYKVVKSDRLSYIKYDGIHLLDNANGQLDLSFEDGRKATLLVKKSEEYIDEFEVSNIKIGDYEVKLLEGLDNINRYYWTKNNVNYVFSFNKSANFSNDEILGIINGFSIEVGENY